MVTIISDLHTHTDFSDGVASMDTLLAKAHACGIRHLAVTDHDTVFHLPQVVKKAKPYNIEIISGVELSLFDYKVKRRVHMLGLFFPDIVPPNVNKVVKELNTRRENFHKILIERFSELGYPLTFADVKKFAPNNIPYKMHIFLALYKKYLQHLSQEELKKFYMEHFGKPQSKKDDELVAYPDIKTGIELILSDGGIPIIAHPNVYDSFDQVEGYITLGLQGIECYHSQMAPSDIERALGIAKKHNLYITGGSDYHGDIFGVPDETLGNFGLNENNYEQLINKIKK